MEPDSILNLFDSFWFYHKNQPNPEPTPVTVSRQLTIHKRSKSDQFTTPNSPNSVLFSPHLETIRSGKQLSIEIPKPQHWKKPNKGFGKTLEKRRLSKSLSELEFEELAGFVDLGFGFSEEEKDSDLIEIIPGLQRLGRESDGPSNGPSEKPYLSEAWEVLERKEESPLMNWRVPANEVDMKDSLKCWAHSVATAAAAAAAR